MPQPIQFKRRTTGPGVPATLLPGEPAYNTSGHELYIGDGASTVQPLVTANRQVEIAGAQTITGVKTMPVANLRLTGGALDNLLRTDGAGNMTWVVPPPPATATGPQMAAGLLNNVYATPLNTMALTGQTVATLATTAKTLVPAINELQAQVALLANGQLFVGSVNATAGTIAWTAASGGAGNALPAPAPANNGWYLIVDVGGASPPVGAPAATYEVGDWLASNGVVWTQLAFGGVTAVLASQVTVNPAVNGMTDVQASLTDLDAVKLDVAVQAPIDAAQDAAMAAADALRVLKAGDTMTGPLELPVAAPTLAVQAANKKYVDDQIIAIPPFTVAVTGPALTGTGAAGSPITFTGIVAEALTFTGNGLTGTPLVLALIDGGTY